MDACVDLNENAGESVSAGESLSAGVSVTAVMSSDVRTGRSTGVSMGVSESISASMSEGVSIGMKVGVNAGTVLSVATEGRPLPLLLLFCRTFLFAPLHWVLQLG